MGKRSRVDVKVQQAVNAPFVAYFPSGNPSSEPTGRDVAFDVYEGSGHFGKGLLVGSKGSVDYVGKTAGDEYTGPHPCNYAVAVYDKASGTLEMMPIHWGKVVRLEARLRTLNYGPTGAGSEYEAAETYEAKRAENKRLVDSFGSTRRRRQLVAAEEGRVKVERLSATTQLADIITKGATEAEKAGYTKSEILKKAADIRNLPPHHVSATTAEQAYRLDEIIPQGCHIYLDVVKLFKASEASASMEELKKDTSYSPYVLSRIHLLSTQDRNLAKRRARALGLLNNLLRMFAAKPLLLAPQGHAGLHLLSQRVKVKSELLEALLELFYVKGSESSQERWERPNTKQELLIAYILVVAALVEVDETGRSVIGPLVFETLRQELKMSVPDLASRFREIGAAVSSGFTTIETDMGSPSKQRSYTVSLLSDRSQLKTLGDSFPGLKVGRGKK